MNVSMAQSGRENSNTNISNIGSAAFDLKQTSHTLQTNRTINTQDRGRLMSILCLNQRQGSYVHFYVELPWFDLEEVLQG